MRQLPLFLRGHHLKDLRVVIMTQNPDKLLDLLLVRSSFAWLFGRCVHPLRDTGGLEAQDLVLFLRLWNLWTLLRSFKILYLALSEAGAFLQTELSRLRD